ncbi:hypothetical protein [Butyrivibrio sp. AE3006]|uniref:hypothetical protein n=1 Tax=Butyrivibrio sp. AE3006 TaxID=1280673 RepID=UPI00040260D4|nr:hypothetical protein [Butyrivibrio sp. AE3006]
MLIDDIAYSTKQGRKFQDSKTAKDYVGDLERIQLSLTPLIADVIKLHTQRRLFEKIEDLEEDNIKSIKSCITSIEKDLDSDKIEQVFASLSQLNAKISDENKYLVQIWRSYKNEKINSYSNLIKALANIIDDATVLDDLAALKIQIDKAELGNDKDISRIAEYVDKSKSLIKSLSLDDDTENFIISITNGNEVTLADVQESTMNWLKDHNLLKRIKLGI